MNRRRFLQHTVSTALAAPFVTSGLRAVSANGKLQHAAIGVGGQGMADLDVFVNHPKFQLVAMADVDENTLRAAKARYGEKFPEVRIYKDWRELFEKEAGNIDSVNVATPDHMHAAAGLKAVALGKHLYGQKPLTQNLWECRKLTEAAREKGVKTQMGIQVSSDFTERFAVEIVHSGIIGKVKAVHSFSEKEWGDMEPVPEQHDEPPTSLDWNGWLGVATDRPFIKGYYHPGNWRKRRDFGTGTLGDMGCHIFSSWYRALGLTAPTKVTSTGAAPANATSWAIGGQVEYIFPATQYTDGTVSVTWYDGRRRPPQHVLDIIEKDPDQPTKVAGQGNIIIGTEGVLLHPHMSTPRLFPRSKYKDFRNPKLEPRDHYREFIDRCIDGHGQPSANFEYAGPLTEAVLLGCLASILPNQTLEWDAKSLSFTNSEEANKFIKRQYRPGWEIA